MALLHGGTTMGGQVVHHYDITGFERGHLHLFDVGEEGGPVHGAVEHHGSGHSAQPERVDEGCGLPVPMRYGYAAAVSAQGSA